MHRSKLAIHGGDPAVTTPKPADWTHGPAEIGNEEIAAVVEVLRSKNLFRYHKDRSASAVACFEDLLAAKTGATHVLAVNSGTSALIVGLVGIGVSQGDEVLVPAYTYVATAAAVLALGAFPVIVEVDAALTMDPQDLEYKITPRTRAIVPVHMRGVACNMEKILQVAQRHHLPVLEDCAQANGAFYKGRAVGTWGQAGAYSLQHYKVVTAGEGGALITSDKRIADRAAIYHDSAYTFWMENQYEGDRLNEWKNIAFLGENYRQSEVHGAIAYEQLKKRDRILARTRSIKRRLWTACENLPGVTLELSHDREGDCGISLILFAQNSAHTLRLAETLQAEGISCGTRFSRQIPDRHVFFHWNYIMEKRSPHLNGFPWSGTGRPCFVDYSPEMCPKTLDYLERAIVFPITQTMSDEYVDQVCAGILKVAAAG